jgi:hypothetical protein
MVPLLYVFKNYQLEFRAQYIASMFLTLIEKVQAAVAVHRYPDEDAFAADFRYLKDEYMGAVSARDPGLGELLQQNVFSAEA